MPAKSKLTKGAGEEERQPAAQRQVDELLVGLVVVRAVTSNEVSSSAYL